MKCQNCGNDIPSDSKVCPKCGHRVETDSFTANSGLFCQACGSSYGENEQYCPHCGNRVQSAKAEKTDMQKDEKTTPSDTFENNTQNNKQNPLNEIFTTEAIKEKWNLLGTFSKAGVVVIGVNLVLFIIALLNQKIGSAVFAFLQIGIAIVAMLMHKAIIKVKSQYAKYIVLSGAAILTILTVIGFSWYGNHNADSFGYVPTSVNSSVTETSSGETETTNFIIEQGTEFAWMSDEWNVYIATAISDSVIKIENWDKALSSTKSMEYSRDIGTYKINDSANGFSWIDDEHTAFAFKIQDKNNSRIRILTSVVFTINISNSDKFKGTNYDKKIACYSMQNDDWHMYRVIPLTETLVKIECWARTSSLDKFCFGWDVGVIDTNNTNTDFKWSDEARTSCTITMKDPENKIYWRKETFVAFTLENDGYTYTNVASFLGKTTDEKLRAQKSGFDSATNEKYTIGQYTVEIPEYWQSEKTITDGIQRYAETGGKVAMLQISVKSESDNNYPVTYDGLMSDNDNMIKAIEASAFSKVTDYDVIDTGTIKGILYKGEINDIADGLTGYGEWFTFASEQDRNWCTFIFTQTNNTEFLYDDDFMKMIESIKPVETPEADTVASTTELESTTEPKSTKKADIVLPDSNSKLGRDFDFRGTSTVYYINVDGTKNIPSLKKWGTATVTDGVADYLDFLTDQGFTVSITSFDSRSPYDGFTIYETNINVSNSEISWTMYLNIQDEMYVEYELDINLP